jgi:hypothetical protein
LEVDFSFNPAWYAMQVRPMSEQEPRMMSHMLVYLVQVPPEKHMLDVASGAFKEVFRRQTSFNAFLLSRMGFSLTPSRQSVPWHAVFISRLHNRRILNAGEMVAASDAVIRAAMCGEENRPTYRCHDSSYSSTVVLDNMPVVKQATVMQNATVLVASHGQVTWPQ